MLLFPPKILVREDRTKFPVSHHQFLNRRRIERILNPYDDNNPFFFRQYHPLPLPLLSLSASLMDPQTRFGEEPKPRNPQQFLRSRMSTVKNAGPYKLLLHGGCDRSLHSSTSSTPIPKDLYFLLIFLL